MRIANAMSVALFHKHCAHTEREGELGEYSAYHPSPVESKASEVGSVLSRLTYM